MEHLYEKLQAYGESDFYPYHMPGHKRRLFGEMIPDAMKMDLTEIDGFDDLHDSRELLMQLQRRAAALYGADESFYLVNGSTGGILSAISAAVPFGGHLLMARGCHRSAYHAAYLRNLRLSYLTERTTPDFGIPEPADAGQVEEALARESDIDALLIVSPTYEGRIADVEKIAEAAHRRGIPLIVDGAHGAHLGFDESERAKLRQADVLINSVHKTLPAMTQTALLHVNGDRVDPASIRRFLRIYQTSSPSYVLMASIDNALTLMEERGGELLGTLRKRYLALVEALTQELRYLKVHPADERQDIGKLVIHRGESRFTGREIGEKLRKEYHLQLELAGGEYGLAMFTVGDTPEGYERLYQALLSIDKEAAPGYTNHGGEERASGAVWVLSDENRPGADRPCRTAATEGISLTEAWDAPRELVPLEAAVCRIAGEFVNLYPPGVPLIVPGERFTKELVRKLERLLQQGIPVQGIFTETGRETISEG